MMSANEALANTRGGRSALLILLLPLLSMGLATALYYSGWGQQLATRQQGQLLPAGLSVEVLGMTSEQLQGHWGVMVLAPQCRVECTQLLQQTEQLHRALGREIPRVRRWLLSTEAPEPVVLVDLPSLQWQPLQSLPQPLQPLTQAQGPLLLLVDPLGNLVLTYGLDEGVRPLLKDLKRLLKISQIG